MQNDLSIKVFQATDFGDKIGMSMSKEWGCCGRGMVTECAWQISRRWRRLWTLRIGIRRFSMRVMSSGPFAVAFCRGEIYVTIWSKKVQVLRSGIGV